MERATGAAATTTRGLLWQSFGYLGGMTAYVVHLMAGVPLVPLSCEIGSTLPLSALNWAVIAVSALATVVSWKIFKASQVDVARTGSTSARRSRFLGFSGTLMNVLAILIVLFVEAHVLVLDPCFPR